MPFWPSFGFGGSRSRRTRAPSAAAPGSARSPPRSRPRRAVCAKPCSRLSKLNFRASTTRTTASALATRMVVSATPDDGWAVEHDRPVRLPECAQEPRDVRRRDVGGMPGRHTGRDQLEVAVLRRGQELGRAVGHARCRSHRARAQRRRSRAASAGAGHRRRRPRTDPGWPTPMPCGRRRGLPFPGIARRERDDGVRVLEHHVELAAELLERLEPTVVPGRLEHVGRVRHRRRTNVGTSPRTGMSEPFRDLVRRRRTAGARRGPEGGEHRRDEAEGDGRDGHRRAGVRRRGRELCGAQLATTEQRRRVTVRHLHDAGRRGVGVGLGGAPGPCSWR